MNFLPPGRSLLVSLLLGIFVFPSLIKAAEAEWQWSVPDGGARAFLWIPPDCARVRGVVLANHNMLEQGILESPILRRELAALGMAEIWVVPAMDGTFDFNKGAGARFERIVQGLAEVSGYGELKFAPVVPLAHSACASFPWNFAAWNPARTLAILSVKGDAPRTKATGNGGPRVDWGDRKIDGVPGLMVVGEYEWGEERILPALDYVAAHPAAPVAFLADPGNGHYNFSDELISFLAQFIHKAAEARLPAEAPLDGPVILRPVDPTTGWRVERWRMDAEAKNPAAPYAQYAGDPHEAFWCFDEEMARATEQHYLGSHGRKPQLLSLTDGQMPLVQGCGEPVSPKFLPLADGMTFRLSAAFMDAVPGEKGNTNPVRWAGLPAGSPLGHASGPIRFQKTVGPYIQTGADTFRLQFGRAEYVPNGRNRDLWVVAKSFGDAEYKSIVQMACIHAEPRTAGRAQIISFPPIAEQKAGVQEVPLVATSDAGLPVQYYVMEGPAEVEGSVLKFSAIPPRAKFPVKVTVVAWQYGVALDVQTAPTVERTFWLVK